MSGRRSDNAGFREDLSVIVMVGDAAVEPGAGAKEGVDFGGGG